MPYLSLSSFVRTDAAILSEEFDVRLVACRSLRGMLQAAVETLRADCLFCWFGSLWFLPLIGIARLRRRPAIVVCGGYDVASLPEIDYGNMARWTTRWLGRLAFRGATAVIAFSRSAAREAAENAHVNPSKIQMIYLAVDDAPERDSMQRTKLPIVLTVSNIDSSTIYRKGLLAVAAVTRLLPDVEFVLVGRGHPEAVRRLKEVAGSNLRIAGFLDERSLAELMGTAKVVLQPSRHEGFGMAVAEAMLRGAVPVVSSRYSLPEVVGDTGFFGEPDDLAELSSSLRRALAADESHAAKSREHVMRHFSLRKRRESLKSLVTSLIESRR